MAQAQPQQRPIKVRTFESARPDEWLTWRRYFENLAQTWGWNDLRQRRELLLAMDGEAARATADLDVNDYADIDLMFEAYQGRFITTAGSDLARTEFTQARQLPDEDLLQFHARVRTLFTRAYPGVAQVGGGLATTLRETYVWGIADTKVSEYVWDRRPDTYPECLRLAQEKQATLARIADQRRTNQRRNGLHQIASAGEEAGRDAGNRTCYVCDRPGHFMRECPGLEKARARGLLALKNNDNRPRGRGNGGGARRGGQHGQGARGRAQNNRRVGNLGNADAQEDESGNEAGRA